MVIIDKMNLSMYNSDEFDELLGYLNAENIPDDQRPCYFYFAVGKILDRRNI